MSRQIKSYACESRVKWSLYLYVKQVDGQWALTETRSIDGVIELPSIGCSLALADVCDKVSLDKA